MYNVEKYIVRCVRSLFKQTLNNIEYIFVDDCSNDQSVSLLKRVLQEYPDKEETVQIIAHERNQGSVTARYTGLQNANGKYILYCDADDYVAPNICELLYNEAEMGGNDIVYCNYVEVKNGQYVYSPPKIVCSSRDEYIKNLLSGELGAYLWNKLVCKDLYDKIDFPFGKNMWEDLYMSIQMFFYAEKIGFLDSEYLYFHNAGNKKCITYLDPKRNFHNMVDNLTNVDSFLEKNGLDRTFSYKRKMYCKMIMLVYGYDVKKWQEIFPEVNKEIYHNKEIPFYLKFIAMTLNHNIYAIRSMYVTVKSLLGIK